MDVLQILKTLHQRLRDATRALAEAATHEGRQEALTRLVEDMRQVATAERDVLFPELEVLSPGLKPLATTASATGVVADKKLKSLAKSISAAHAPAAHDVADLEAAIQAHCDGMERGLLLKLRSAVRTEDREDLGQLVADALATAPAPGVRARVESEAAGRLRA